MALQKYHAFLKVVELGSITRAAEALGYTQSAVSRMVADLEDEWNLSLLRRSRGGLSLSSDGMLLLPYIKELCRRHADLLEQVNALKGIDTGFIRIAAFSSISTHHLPAILKRFRERYPKIEFQLHNMEYEQTIEALCAGEIDCGFIGSYLSDEVDSHFLMRDRMLAIIPPDHPLADADYYPLQRLSGERFIKLSDGTDTEILQILTALNSLLDTPIRAFYDVNDDYSIMAMVESGLGVSVLPELVTERMPFDIRRKEFDKPQFRDISIAVKHGRKPSPATERFIQVVLEYFAV